MRSGLGGQFLPDSREFERDPRQLFKYSRRRGAMEYDLCGVGSLAVSSL